MQLNWSVLGLAVYHMSHGVLNGEPAGGGSTNGSRKSAVPPGRVGLHSAHDTPGRPLPAHGCHTGPGKRVQRMRRGSTDHAAQTSCVRGIQLLIVPDWMASVTPV